VIHQDALFAEDPDKNLASSSRQVQKKGRASDMPEVGNKRKHPRGLLCRMPAAGGEIKHRTGFRRLGIVSRTVMITQLSGNYGFQAGRSRLAAVSSRGLQMTIQLVALTRERLGQFLRQKQAALFSIQAGDRRRRVGEG
jgi:hypothetical protein